MGVSWEMIPSDVREQMERCLTYKWNSFTQEDVYVFLEACKLLNYKWAEKKTSPSGISDNYMTRTKQML
jgi:hypothetical protein